MPVPSAPENKLDTTAMSSEATSALVSSSSAKTCPYHRIVKPSQDWLYRPLVSLKPNAIITRIGSTSQTITTQVYACSTATPVSRRRGRTSVSGPVGAGRSRVARVIARPPS